MLVKDPLAGVGPCPPHEQPHTRTITATMPPTILKAPTGIIQERPTIRPTILWGFDEPA